MNSMTMKEMANRGVNSDARDTDSFGSPDSELGDGWMLGLDETAGSPHTALLQ